jgi:CHAD domain-containing protein
MADPRPASNAAATEAPAESASAPRSAPSEPFLVFAHKVLRRELEALVAQKPEPGVTPSAEDIHQLRVAARRLRVALRLFRQLLPSRPVAELRAELKWFAGALGDVRDLDVYADNFHDYAVQVPAAQREALDAYEVHLRRARAEARGRLAAHFADPRSGRLFAAAATFLAEGPSAGALRRWRSLSTRDGIRASLRKSLKRLRKRAAALTARSSAADFHEVRIRAKRLRYELEFFAEVYPALTAYAKATKALQEILGEHQDAATASARLRSYGQLLRRQAGTATRLPPALDALRRAQLAHARGIRQSFPADWQRFATVVEKARRAVD